MKRSLKWTVVTAATVGVLVAGFVGGRAWAGGIPAAGALTYSGLLQDATGAPLSGTQYIEVKFWNDPTASAATNLLCDTGTPGVAPLTNGRFSIPLPDKCTTQVGSNVGIWAEVIVGPTADAAATLGRAKIGAVPFAVEANHAVSADTAATANAAGGALDARIKALEPATQVTAWTAFTPTMTAGSATVPAADISASDGNYRRVGDSIEVSIIVRFKQSSTDNSVLVFKLPMGYQGHFPSADSNTVVGEGELWNGSYTTAVLVQLNAPVDTHGVTLDINGGGSVLRSSVGTGNYYVGIHFMVPVNTLTTSSP